eukprot:1518845-Rhodomonas_salina.1
MGVPCAQRAPGQCRTWGLARKFLVKRLREEALELLDVGERVGLTTEQHTDMDTDTDTDTHTDTDTQRHRTRDHQALRQHSRGSSAQGGGGVTPGKAPRQRGTAQAEDPAAQARAARRRAQRRSGECRG